MEIQAKLKHTEDPEKLKEYIENTIPGSKVKKKSKMELKGKSDFKEFWKTIEKRGSGEIFLEEMKKRKKGNKTQLHLSKIAMSKGKAEIYSGSAIGKVTLSIPWEKIEETASNKQTEQQQEQS